MLLCLIAQTLPAAEDWKAFAGAIGTGAGTCYVILHQYQLWLNRKADKESPPDHNGHFVRPRCSEQVEEALLLLTTNVDHLTSIMKSAAEVGQVRHDALMEAIHYRK